MVTHATVTLRNVDTGMSRSAETDDSGFYRFVSLAPGPSELTATTKGLASEKTDLNL